MEYNFKPFDKVLVRDSDDENWSIDLFESIDEINGWYVCFRSRFIQCIPYEGNEYLLGTKVLPDNIVCSNQATCNHSPYYLMHGIKVTVGMVLYFKLAPKEPCVVFDTYKNGLAVLTPSTKKVIPLPEINPATVYAIQDVPQYAGYDTRLFLWESDK